MGDGSNEGISRFFMGKTDDPVLGTFLENFPADLLAMTGFAKMRVISALHALQVDHLVLESEPIMIDDCAS